MIWAQCFSWNRCRRMTCLLARYSAALAVAAQGLAEVAAASAVAAIAL